MSIELFAEWLKTDKREERRENSFGKFSTSRKPLIFSQEAKTICDFIRPSAKKPRLDRKEEPIS